MSFVRSDVRGRLFRRIPGLGGQITLTDVEADGVIHPTSFQNSEGGVGDFAGSLGYRPNVAVADQVRTMGEVDGSKLFQTGASYADITDKAFENYARLHPYIVNDCIRRCLRHIYLNYYAPVGPWLDNDFATAGVATPHDWAAGSNTCTPTKVTTSGPGTQAGQSGPRNLLTTNSGAGGYVRSSDFYVNPGDQFVHWFIGRVNGAFTGSYVLYDLTHGVALETVQFGSRAFVRGLKTTTIPEGCFQVELRLGGVDAAAVVEWDCIGGHLAGDEQRTLEMNWRGGDGAPWLTRRFQFIGLHAGTYGRMVDDDLVNATSRQLKGWYPGDDYEPLPLAGDANVSNLQINRRGGLPAQDMWVQAKRSWTSIDDMVNESVTTNADEDSLMAAAMFEVLTLLATDADSTPQEMAAFSEAADDAAAILALQRVVDQPPQPKREQPMTRIGMRI